MTTHEVVEGIVHAWLDGDDEARPIVGDLAEEVGADIYDYAARFARDEDEIRLIAMCEHLECEPDEVSVGVSGPLYGEGQGYEYGREEWAVLSEEEAEAAWEESLDNYLDECILPELAEPMRTYFDRDAWKRDARHDGRGHCLSGYDGNEHEVHLAGTWYFLYRLN